VASTPEIYPNPVTDYLTLRNVYNLKQISIYNMNGVNIWSRDYTGEQGASVPVSGLPAGVYSLRITAADRLFTCRFIKK
jgi:hypothetical protein